MRFPVLSLGLLSTGFYSVEVFPTGLKALIPIKPEGQQAVVSFGPLHLPGNCPPD